MPIYSSSVPEESNDCNSLNGKLFGREQPLHSVLGGGQVADIILWRNKSLSAAIMLGFTTIWFLFEVLEYTFVSVVFYSMILGILMVFIGRIVMSALLPFYRNSTDLTDEKKLYIALAYLFLGAPLLIRNFLVTELALLMTSVIVNHFSPLNLLFFCVICLGTLPVFYEKCEKEVDFLINKGMKYATKKLKNFEKYVKEKKAN
ncbi:hypothetical protein HanRHA438_Chr17g0837741 [Helianthus annuus]|nr:reticulon-like protein B6 [Helianthus annuus]KAJ0430855.1 hypothetical protein HanHA300_Chr17g0673801 [Helianthus annuus]KAJ0435901.1 hypothetical protein HanIR_Chr17g0898501 [Helianthus annuus]KAJ0449307.1 hypothetical protein HanHA89_Chr17g0726931 [Helianthus annuus]KAJ0637960.1 hypothetical protein HanOQP8_Chr17g0679891 [Helianthus annuus]KAJ0828487.1 hypothetical protein HanRHA438_Chr17g0837741 [Helianthus annuus]